MTNKLKIWLQEIRAPFFTASIVPILLGTIIAFNELGHINWVYFLLTLIGGILLHAGANVVNDYFDHKSLPYLISIVKSFHVFSGKFMNTYLLVKHNANNIVHFNS
mgnify:CR=1 FL=1